KMQALLEAGLDGRTARIPSAETMANEYVYAKDVGTAVDLAATVPVPPVGTFNIGSGVVTPFVELIAAVQGLLPTLRYEIAPGAAPESKEWPLDISAARRQLGREPRYDLRAGLEDYLAELRAARASR